MAWFSTGLRWQSPGDLIGGGLDENGEPCAALDREQPVQFVVDGNASGGCSRPVSFALGLIRKMYQPFPREKFENTERELWFQELVEHIRPQAESQPHTSDPARLAELPRAARALYFLWGFYAEVGGNGIECYLLDAKEADIQGAHEALRVVGAWQLAERLEAGIPHALAEGCAEFSTSPDLTWFKKFSPDPKYPTLQSVDVNIYPLVSDDLRDKANAFIAAEEGVLVS
ncbi:MAG TPA: hypothetical protein VJA21_02200 [Verrucomicrobiae bacterium]